MSLLLPLHVRGRAVLPRNRSRKVSKHVDVCMHACLLFCHKAELTLRLKQDDAALDREELPLIRELGVLYREVRVRACVWDGKDELASSRKHLPDVSVSTWRNRATQKSTEPHRSRTARYLIAVPPSRRLR